MTNGKPLTAGLLAALPLSDEAFSSWLQGCAVDRQRYQELLATAKGGAALSQFENHQILWYDVNDETYAVIGVVSGGLGYFAIAHDAEPPGIEEARRQRRFFAGKPKECEP